MFKMIRRKRKTRVLEKDIAPPIRVSPILYRPETLRMRVVSARGRKQARSYVGCWWLERNPFAFYELNAQLHADLPTQELQENFDAALSIRGILNDRNQPVKRTATDLH